MSAEKAVNKENSTAAEKDVIRFRTTAAQQPAEKEDTIDLMMLLGELLSKWYILVAAFILGAVLLGLYTLFFVTPQYKGTSKIYIYSKTTSITSLADLQIGSQLTSDFQIIAKTREVVEEVINQTGVSYSYEKLASKVTINNPSSSRILEVVVTDPDPEVAAVLSNTLANVLRARIGEVTNTDEPSLVEKAVVDNKRVSPSYKKNILLGGLVFFVIAAIIIIAIFLLDDSIKTDEDVKKYLGLNTLAMIPVNRNLTNSSQAVARARSSGKK